MARARKGHKIDGWVNLDKPVGMTSTKALAIVRRIFQAQKGGHAGTLDPLASGILPVALGEATKTISFFQDAEKTYSFTIRWGEARDTDDAEGAVIATSLVMPTADQIIAALPRFTGLIMQKPPSFSAIKLDGQRAYDLARDGAPPDLPPRPVQIDSLSLVEARPQEADFRVICGKGTYIRSLARDLAELLGTKGYIALLRREAVGAFTAENAISLDFLDNLPDSAALMNALWPLEKALDDIPALSVNEGESARLRSGQKLSFLSRPDHERLIKAGLDGGTPKAAVALFQGRAVALVSVEACSVKPVRVINL